MKKIRLQIQSFKFYLKIGVIPRNNWKNKNSYFLKMFRRKKIKSNTKDVTTSNRFSVLARENASDL